MQEVWVGEMEWVREGEKQMILTTLILSGADLIWTINHLPYNLILKKVSLSLLDFKPSK